MANNLNNLKNLKPFKKGVSGNENGRPKKLPEIDELLIEVLSEEKNGRTVFKSILIKLTEMAIKGDIRAAEVLFNRAYGFPKQNIHQDNYNNRMVELRIIRDPKV